MSFGWHPREHRKALEGMLTLTLEERGAYNTVLDLIYDREGPIPDDARWLAGWMGVSLRKWTTIRAALIVKGKLFALNFNGVDCLMNQRAAIELENQTKRARNSRENGAKGGRKSAETDPKPSEINADPEPTGNPGVELKTETETYTGLSVVPSNEETTGGQPPGIDPNAKAWRDGVDVLVALGGMKPAAARTFFGRLLKDHDLDARDLLSAIGQIYNQQTGDPQSFLKAAAKRRERRSAGPPKRVGFV